MINKDEKSLKNIADAIPVWPYADEKEENAIRDVLHSASWWRNAGTKVKQFEQDFARYHECKGGIAVSNGTVAIEIALKALKIRQGDEVIVPAFTFYSTVSAVLAVGAIPVIVDVLEDTFCIDSAQIELAVTKKTKAIIVVHMGGQIAEMDKIIHIAREQNLYVIEDCSHAHGAVYNKQKAGSFADLSTFSFQNAKLITAGEGGIILSNNCGLLNNVLLESNCGRMEGDTTYQHVLIGTNARLSEVQGAILLEQLARLDNQIKVREENYQYIYSLLKKVPGIRFQTVSNKVNINSHYMVMFYYNKDYFCGKTRDNFVSYLKEKGIPCNRAYEAIHKLPVFETLDSKKWRVNQQLTNAEKISKEVVCLNHNILLGDKKLMENISTIIANFAQRNIERDN